MIKDDTLWKGIIEDLTIYFLRFFIKDADQLFDFKKGFQFLDKELEQLFPVEDGEAPKFVDKLVKVFTKKGKEEWILIHIEVQGYYDKGFTKRMFTYFYRILDRYDKSVMVIAIFTDSSKKFCPSVYEYEYLGTKNIFSFNTYKVLDQDEEKLAKDGNPFAIVVLTVLLALKKKKLGDEGLLKLKLDLFRNLFGRNMDKKVMRGLATFLKLYVHFAKPETNTKFEQEIQIITENIPTMGIEEMVLQRAEKKGIEKGIAKGIEKGIEKGRKEGREEGKTEVVKNLIVKMGLSDEQVADVAAMPIAFVKKVRDILKK